MTKPVVGIPADFYPPDLEEVPTVRELVRNGLARVQVANAGGDPSIVTIMPEGQRLIYEAMQRNAERMRRWHEVVAARTREPVLTG